MFFNSSIFLPSVADLVSAVLLILYNLNVNIYIYLEKIIINGTKILNYFFVFDVSGDNGF